ncbi:putative Na+/H+ antiporter [Listeria floridensis FSL S10-1187]|uniref:Na+/H+ antiporter n=1 Tax=Listeria floridensis FSL S10-1187 TaxID=1265817 RepID=A0ABN0RHK4_9LIST|nr:putative Na+/H+ antiporter [Listeria floridensis FSL S10-1187]
MEVFEFILIMLGAVFLSNVLSRFLPSISIPLIQIGLGVLIAVPFLGFQYEMEIDPELFMLLFIAPLLFSDGKNADKTSLWKWRKPIFILAIILVFCTVFLLGGVIHSLLPVVPHAAAFALAAALAPTDAVAVGSLADKIKIPHKALHILEGESLINDASGLVSFQFAVLALMTGTFSLTQASISFLLISLGGVLLGAILSLFKSFLMRWLRQLGIENIISFMLMDILTPFIIYLVAEKLGVNGILAVVSGGLVQSLGYQKMNPESAKLNTISKNTWSVIIFSLNGIVFVLLGTQLPHIATSIFENSGVSNFSLIGYVLLILVVLLGLRFLLLLLFRSFSQEKKSWRLRVKDAILYTLSGVRGTISLVSALSLPLVLGNGEKFAERDLLIAIAAGVILCTLVLSNFLLPLLAEKNQTNHDTNQEMEKAILRDVVKKLKKEMTQDNEKAMQILIHMYNRRIFELAQSSTASKDEKAIRLQVLDWQIEYTLSLYREEKISIQTFSQAIRRLNKHRYQLTHDKRRRNELARMMFIKWHTGRLSFKDRKEERTLLQRGSREYIYKKLKKTFR